MKKICTILGTIGGIIFGLLFAQKTGKELRTELNKTKDTKEIIEVLVKALKEAGKGSYKEARELAKHPDIKKFLDQGHQKISDLEKYIQKEGQYLINKAKKEVSKKITNKTTKKNRLIKKSPVAKTKKPPVSKSKEKSKK